MASIVTFFYLQGIIFFSYLALVHRANDKYHHCTLHDRSVSHHPSFHLGPGNPSAWKGQHPHWPAQQYQNGHSWMEIAPIKDGLYQIPSGIPKVDHFATCWSFYNRGKIDSWSCNDAFLSFFFWPLFYMVLFIPLMTRILAKIIRHLNNCIFIIP